MTVLAMQLIRFYQKFISGATSPKCRHLPTCSDYAYEAFQYHGFLKGFFLAVLRIFRCHPWSSPKVDPVPLGDSKGSVYSRTKVLAGKIRKRKTRSVPLYSVHGCKNNMKVNINAD